MSYENAVPKPLKFLISDGKLVDEQGNVIAESERLQDLYIKWNPEVKKYLLSDGSVVDENNNLIIKNEYYKKMYDQADPKVAKYLHSDGTVDENPGGGSATVYAWVDDESNIGYYNFDVAPANQDDYDNSLTMNTRNLDTFGITIEHPTGIYDRISDTKFELMIGKWNSTFTRDSTKDFTLWQLSE